MIQVKNPLKTRMSLKFVNLAKSRYMKKKARRAIIYSYAFLAPNFVNKLTFNILRYILFNIPVNIPIL